MKKLQAGKKSPHRPRHFHLFCLWLVSVHDDVIEDYNNNTNNNKHHNNKSYKNNKDNNNKMKNYRNMNNNTNRNNSKNNNDRDVITASHNKTEEESKIIKVVVDADLHIPCISGFLHVYDGVPPSFNVSSRKLAALCNNNHNNNNNNNNKNNNSNNNNINKNNNFGENKRNSASDKGARDGGIEGMDDRNHVLYATSGTVVILLEYYVPSHLGAW